LDSYKQRGLAVFRKLTCFVAAVTAACLFAGTVSASDELSQRDLCFSQAKTLTVGGMCVYFSGPANFKQNSTYTVTLHFWNVSTKVINYKFGAYVAVLNTNAAGKSVAEEPIKIAASRPYKKGLWIYRKTDRWTILTFQGPLGVKEVTVNLTYKVGSWKTDQDATLFGAQYFLRYDYREKPKQQNKYVMFGPSFMKK
jgi:hypothetical protein